MESKEKIKVIIIDDNSNFIEGLSLMLSKNESFTIIDTCKNGLELVNNLKLSKADLLLVDIEMPEMNGLEAATKVNINYPQLPMIALTMQQDRVCLLDMVSSGFKGFVYKPEIPKKLMDVINQVLLKKFVFPENLKIN